MSVGPILVPYGNRHYNAMAIEDSLAQRREAKRHFPKVTWNLSL